MSKDNIVDSEKLIKGKWYKYQPFLTGLIYSNRREVWWYFKFRYYTNGIDLEIYSSAYIGDNYMKDSSKEGYYMGTTQETFYSLSSEDENFVFKQLRKAEIIKELDLDY